jgi:hypothetical protein
MSVSLEAAAGKKLFDRRQLLLMGGISAGYLLLSYLLIGFRPEQLFLTALVNTCYFSSHASRRFITGFSVFIIYWVIFDYMKAFPNYRYAPVHIESLYDLERSVFGIHTGGKILTPNEYWLVRQNSCFDVVTGFFYLTWIPVPLGLAAYLFFRDKKQFMYFSCTFLLVNLIGFVIYYLYPAAPPWYVQLHGFGFNPHTPGNTAGLARFDAFFHVHIFSGLYAKSSNVFAAMPSLHSAYPVIVFYFGWKNRLGKVNILFGLLMVGIWFAAVYNSHHYVLDVIAGLMCAVLGIWLFGRIINSRNPVRKWIQGIINII